MKEKILAKLQELREEDLAAMEFAAERSVEMMQAYCGLEDLPEELTGVGVMMAGMLLDGGLCAAKVKSIREGDISVAFAEGMNGTDGQEIFRCFREELNRYRKMKW